MLIEAMVGREIHSSFWGKGYLQGCKLVAESTQNDSHHSYTEGAAEVEDGTILSWWTSDGNKRGPQNADFYLLKASSVAEPLELTGGCYGSGNYLRGQFEVLAHGKGKTMAPRLLKWWTEWATTNGGQTEQMTRHLAEQLKIRGLSTPNPIQLEKLS